MSINFEMMDKIIAKYKENFPKIHEEEIYKWRAVKCFQDNWDIEAEDFYDMLSRSLEKTKNLLTSINNYPKGMLLLFTEKAPDKVREMFSNLFNEGLPVTDRINKFIDSSSLLLQEYGGEKDKLHYQSLNSISVYLFLKYPGNYYLYKYNKYRQFAKKISYPILPQKGKSESVKDYFDMCNEILLYIKDNKELLQMSKERLTNEDYADEEYHLLTEDIIFFGSNFKIEDEWWPSLIEYDPGIGEVTWLELLNNPEVFTEGSLSIMKRLLDVGGSATCVQLSDKYGESYNFYNSGSSSLAKRVWNSVQCPLLMKNDENSKWWPILYQGKYADKDTKGKYTWKLRPELKSALEQIDLSNIPLYITDTPDSNIKYWWLNANPKVWSMSSIKIGEVEGYNLLNEAGNKRRIYQNFIEAKEGDIVIGYESSPVKQIVATFKVTVRDEKALYFEKIEGLPNPIDYSLIKETNELKNMEFFSNPQGSLFKLTDDEYNLILDIIREYNPLSKIEGKTPYTKEDFLSVVYMDESEYIQLVSLLKHKKNIILQGAPGVGKTFAAKRLAYSMLGSEDDDKIKLVQFHQNYSYEDFVMGYKPYNDGFKLMTGVFYEFCKKAENNPNDDYFFIIDEINRGNLSKIFGELLMLIEKDYRGEKMTLAYNGLPFSVPEKLHIIGMMNTADRSLAMIDYALRRRFSFFEMKPAFENKVFKLYQESLTSESFDNLIGVIKDLNYAISDDPSLGEGFCIGHSYFCGIDNCTDDRLIEIVEYDIIPMIKEYWFDDISKVDVWTNKLRGVFND